MKNDLVHLFDLPPRETGGAKDFVANTARLDDGCDRLHGYSRGNGADVDGGRNCRRGFLRQAFIVGFHGVDDAGEWIWGFLHGFTVQ